MGYLHFSSIVDFINFKPVALTNIAFREKAEPQTSNKKAAYRRFLSVPKTDLLEIGDQRIAHGLWNRVDRRFVARMIYAHG